MKEANMRTESTVKIAQQGIENGKGFRRRERSTAAQRWPRGSCSPSRYLVF